MEKNKEAPLSFMQVQIFMKCLPLDVKAVNK